MEEHLSAEFATMVEEIAELPPGSVTPDKQWVEDLDVDSLAMVEIAAAVKDRWGVRLATDDSLGDFRTVGDVLDRIAAGAHA